MARRNALRLWCGTAMLLAAGWLSAADRASTPRVEVALQAERAQAVAGETLWLGLRFDLIPHWHVYWRNPGDSGEAPRIDWQLPPGWRAGDIHWPVPERIPVGPLTNYGYEDSVTLLVPLEVPGDVPPGETASVVADASWLVCREECIPEAATLRLDLPVAAATDSAASAADPDFAAVRSAWPLPFPGQAAYRPGGDGQLELRLDAEGWSAARIAELWLASEAWGAVAASGAQTWSLDAGQLVLRVPAGDLPPAAGAPLPALLVLTEQTDDGPLRRGFTLAASPAAVPATGPDTTLLLALGLAFAGGLLLNLMPCVLPVLSIKALGLVQHAGRDGVRHGLVFVAGVLSSFALLAGLLLVLRASGSALGWGFQLQEPLVVVGLLYLMLAVALNLSGVYALGGGLAGLGQGMTERQGLGGTFATGVLAVLVASPCTAPFMGSALGFALTRPASEALAVFLALGAGFAAPVMLLSIWPRWVRLLPAPGVWMERLRNVLAFPMYAAAAWLLWVLSQQVSAQALGSVLAGALLLAFALWWYGQPLRNRRRQLTIALSAALLSLGLAAFASLQGPPPQTTTAATWSNAEVSRLREQGRPVLVNFTAAWCITCKVNERVALDREAVRAALARHDIAYLKADWTRRDPEITRELERHGRSGVPLYLLYPANDGNPRVLPQLLTEGLVLQSIDDFLKEI